MARGTTLVHATGPMRPASIALLLASCATAPAARSPLREALAAADRVHVDEAVTACLTASGWKVDPLPGTMADADVLTGAKAGGEETKVYVHGRDMAPRITGGPDDRDRFWDCLATELVHPGTAEKELEHAAAAESDAGGRDAGGREAGSP